MKRMIIVLAFVFLLAVPVYAAEYTAPTVPDSGQMYFPEDPKSFSDGLLSILKKAIAQFHPAIGEASSVCLGMIAVSILISIAGSISESGKRTAELVGTLCVAASLLGSSHAFIRMSMDTVNELSEYGKLLLPVLSGAVAAQGGTATSAAIYVGTVAFDTVLCTAIAKLLRPMLYLYLCLSIGHRAIGQVLLKNLCDFIKWLMIWCLKTILYVFVGYIGITGVASGATDASALKAARLTISGMVPVVGGILSDASEAVLVSAGLVKSTAGIYGMLAVLSICVGPFIRIGAQYLMMKATGAVCHAIDGSEVSI